MFISLIALKVWLHFSLVEVEVLQIGGVGPRDGGGQVEAVGGAELGSRMEVHPDGVCGQDKGDAQLCGKQYQDLDEMDPSRVCASRPDVVSVVVRDGRGREGGRRARCKR